MGIRNDPEEQFLGLVAVYDGKKLESLRPKYAPYMKIKKQNICIALLSLPTLIRFPVFLK